MSLFLGRYLLPKRHRGLVCSAQAWMQGMPELYSETWQLGLLAHCGLLAPNSPAAGQKLSIQLIQQQILKKSFNSLGWAGDSTADLPSSSLPAHHSYSKEPSLLDLSAGWGLPRGVWGSLALGAVMCAARQDHPAHGSLWLSWFQWQPGFVWGAGDAGKGMRRP